MNTFSALLFSFNALAAADASQTAYALQHGAVEAWLPSQSPWATSGLVAAQAVSVDVAALKLRKDHPKWALALVIGVTAARGYVVVHNARTLQSR